MLERGRRMIGLLLMLVSVTALVAWEKWGKDRFLYDDILVLNQNVERGTVITEEMLEVRHMDAREPDSLTPEQRQAVVGREAAFFLHKNVPLFSACFAEAGLTADADRDRYVLQIPGAWLTGFPLTLSRGDRVWFFCGGDRITSAQVDSVDQEHTTFSVVVSAAQAGRLSALIDGNRLLTVVYA